eukprot:4416781-Prymnesium_polylepis.1
MPCRGAKGLGPACCPSLCAAIIAEMRSRDLSFTPSRRLASTLCTPPTRSARPAAHVPRDARVCAPPSLRCRRSRRVWRRP